MDGILIAVEGVDGAGKTTQVELLANALREAGEQVIVSKEPTEGEWGQVIRRSAKEGRLPIKDEIHAFLQDRLEHVRTLINPALEAGHIVILDRYYYSFLAYQGARGADHEKLLEANGFAPRPDIVFLLDIDPRQSLPRITHLRGDQLNNFETVEQLDRARHIFLDIAGKRDHIVTLNAAMGIRDVRLTIAQCLFKSTLKKKRCYKAYGCDDPLHCMPRATGQCKWPALQSIIPVDDDMPALIRAAGG